MISRKAALLVLRGIKPEEFTSTVSTPAKQEPAPVYVSLPARYVGASLWVQTTNLKCWNCDLVPTSYPRFIPFNLEFINKREECDAVGCMCSWNCAATYVRRHYSDVQLWDLLWAISIIESHFTGRIRKIIPDAPDKTLMQQYRGPTGLTAKQWRDALEKINNEYDIAG